MATRQGTRFSQVSEATADERRRFNRAIENGARVYIEPAQGGCYIIRYIDANWFYHTTVEGQSSFVYGMTWAGCNDAQWARLLRDAGVSRNPLFA